MSPKSGLSGHHTLAAPKLSQTCNDCQFRDDTTGR
jgi:hypothetical protein